MSPRLFAALLFLLPAASIAAEPPPPRTILLIAGPPDATHAAGTHEYAATVNALAAMLDGSNVDERVAVKKFAGTWPTADELAAADTVFVTGRGSDHDEADHPLLAPGRWEALEREFDRGCGLVVIHWATFFPDRMADPVLNNLGGYFDYAGGEGKNGWQSAIDFADRTVTPATPGHAVLEGVEAFQLHDEFYHHLKFPGGVGQAVPDAAQVNGSNTNSRQAQPDLQGQWTSLLTVPLPAADDPPQTVAWSLERPTDAAATHRAVGFTGGHFAKNADLPDYHRFLLNALAWTARVEVPAGGVRTFDELWTPAAQRVGKAEPYEREKEPDWVDDRFRAMDTGPFFSGSIKLPGGGMVRKGIAVSLGGDPPVHVLFDTGRCLPRCGWTGDFLHHSDRRFGLIEMPEVGGEPLWEVPEKTTRNIDVRWRTGGDGLPDAACVVHDPAEVHYRGLRLDGPRVTFEYVLDGVAVAETYDRATGPLAEADPGAVIRTVEVGPAEVALELPILPTVYGRDPGVIGQSDRGIFLSREAGWAARADFLFIQVGDSAGGEDAAGWGSRTFLNRASNGCYGVGTVLIPPSDEVRRMSVTYHTAAADGDRLGNGLTDSTPLYAKPRPPERTADPTPRWGRPLVTTGTRGTPLPETGGAFAVDTVPLPFENPWDALLYTSGVDFTPASGEDGGTAYLAAAHGDVWRVTGLDDGLDRVEWRRFATGLYQPLGLKVRDGQVYVLGRDRITRLVDVNGDGEADRYENFNDGLEILGQPHAYAMGLETDPAGNFYFMKSGPKETPHGGTALKVSADGSTITPIATGFRHPNGIGVSPDGTVTAADNEGNWIPATPLMVVRGGEAFGYNSTARRPRGYTPAPPLLWLPREVDTSAGGQVWVPEDRWGPLAGSMLHTSFGRCTLNLIYQDEVHGTPQGAVSRIPGIRFLSGSCRGRFMPGTGDLWVVGLNGWQTAAVHDGCLQRVRYTGAPVRLPTAVHAVDGGLELTFAAPLDPIFAADADRWGCEAWTYRRTADYGSPELKPSDPEEEGHDEWLVTAADLSDDGRTVRLTIPDLQPVMQYRVHAALRGADGVPTPVDVYGTLHAVP